MSNQGRYWILTIPASSWNPTEQLPTGVVYLKGQKEIGSDTSYEHWQVLAVFNRKIRLRGVKAVFSNDTHAELTRTSAANDYVWKEETRVAGTQFEYGELPLKRNSKEDWCKVKEAAKRGALEEVPSDIFVRHYFSLKRIAKDNSSAPYRPNIRVFCFWGVTGSGKSHRAFEEAAASKEPFYVKSSTTKWWDSYKGEKIVIIDEFRGQIAVEHLLKWFDKYPCYVEEKGGQLPLMATTFYIMSNLDPRNWFEKIDEETRKAFLRRLTITQFLFRYNEVGTTIELPDEQVDEGIEQ